MDTKAKVKSFIIDNFLYGDDSKDVGVDQSFYDNGIVDSTGVLAIINYIEENYNVSVADEEITPENFDTIGRIAEYIERKNREEAKV